MRLISFLIQLRPHFPSWKGTLNIFYLKISDRYLFSVLSWDVVIETLMEYVDDTHDGSDLRIRSSINRVCSPLVVNVNTDFKISVTPHMVDQISRRLSSEYVLI